MNENVRKALIKAAVFHKGAVRKGTDIPYIVHPYEVAMILQENGMEDKVIVAGLLHDTLEDTKMKESNLKEAFGEEILQLVKGASEKLKDRRNTLWEDRKKHTIEYLKKAPFEVKCIACADKLSNIRSMISDHHDFNEELWERFMESDKEINGQEYSREYKKKKQKWYYQGVVNSLKELEGLKMYQELKKAVHDFFEDYQNIIF